MTKVTWKGESGGPDKIDQFGHTFPKGEAVDVAATHPNLDKFRGNPHFEVEEEAEPDDPTGYEPVHKGRGVWAVKGPNGFMTPGSFTKEEAAAFAAEKNGPAPAALPAPEAETVAP